MTIGRRLNRAAKLRFLRSHPAPPQPPDGYVTVASEMRHFWPTGFAPAEAMQEQAQNFMRMNRATFRDLDKGKDYDLAARTKAARSRRGV